MSMSLFNTRKMKMFPKMSIGYGRGWFGDSIRHSRARKFRKSGGPYRIKLSTGRMVYIDGRSGKFRRNVSYPRYLQGLELQRKNRLHQAENRLGKKVFSYTLPPAGKVIDAYETMQDVSTIMKKGKK